MCFLLPNLSHLGLLSQIFLGGQSLLDQLLQLEAGVSFHCFCESTETSEHSVNPGKLMDIPKAKDCP